MAIPKPKRRHHVNPRFYLRAFEITNEEGYLWRYDSATGDALKLSIDDASVQRDYFSHVNEDGLRDTEMIENFVADVENICSPVFRKALNQN